MKNSLFILVLLILLIVSSCTKEQFENCITPDTSQYEVISENGILNFNSFEDFRVTINQLIDDPNFSEQIKSTNFISLSNHPRNLSKSSPSEVIEEDTLVLSDAFAALLNTEREIIVQGILYKVCKHGTLLAYPKDSLILKDIAEKETISENIQQVNGGVFGYSNNNPLSKFYRIIGKEEIFLFDTYGLFIEDKENSASSTSINKSSNPNYEIFTTVTENSRTLFGKGWDFLFGFSISREENFDSKTVVDTKFYAQNFVVYSETGIKVKTQRKGFLGIWSKIESDELRVGWDYLEIKETWPSMTKDFIQQMYNEIQPYCDPYTGEYNKWLAISNLAFKKKTILTVDLVVDEYKITNKQLYKKVVGEAWRWIKNGLSQNNNPSKPTSEDQIEGIREFSPNKPYSAVTKIGTYEQVAFNSDKLTFIINNDFGFIVSLNVGLGNPDGATYTPGFKGVASDYEILKASMYGCARRGDTWKGIRLNYKYN